MARARAAHPDVWSGKKQGYFGRAPAHGGARVVPLDVNWYSLLPHVSHVYTVSSHAGMEALIAGVPVTCFGMPWYAGWGLTDDRQTCARRTRRRTLAEVVAAAYLRYARYVDPVSGRACRALDVVELLARQRRWNERNRGYTAVLGVFRWKRPHVKPFLQSTGGDFRFFRSASRAVRAAVRRRGRIVVWGGFEPPGLAGLAASAGVPVTRMEDGFIRSAGLGSDLVRASSLVFDDSGIYYDPASSSALERMLMHGDFDAEELRRAAALRQRIVDARITKYNYGAQSAATIVETLDTCGRTRLLVPGQVEDDKSIRLGAPDPSTNLDLLRRVREANPDAFIVYKPHPDVEAGNRVGRVDPARAAELADMTVSGLSATALLDHIDEVHTLTSLLGFEALMRGKRVTVYGMPFYAGWGLTTDRLPLPRRGRIRTLDELAAAALLRYPVYFDWNSGYPCELEQLLGQLGARPPARPAGWWMRKFRTVKGWLGG